MSIYSKNILNLIFLSIKTHTHTHAISISPSSTSSNAETDMQDECVYVCVYIQTHTHPRTRTRTPTHSPHPGSVHGMAIHGSNIWQCVFIQLCITQYTQIHQQKHAQCHWNTHDSRQRPYTATSTHLKHVHIERIAKAANWNHSATPHISCYCTQAYMPRRPAAAFTETLFHRPFSHFLSHISLLRHVYADTNKRAYTQIEHRHHPQPNGLNHKNKKQQNTNTNTDKTSTNENEKE